MIEQRNLNRFHRARLPAISLAIPFSGIRMALGNAGKLNDNQLDSLLFFSLETIRLMYSCVFRISSTGAVTLTSVLPYRADSAIIPAVMHACAVLRRTERLSPCHACQQQ